MSSVAGQLRAMFAGCSRCIRSVTALAGRQWPLTSRTSRGQPSCRPIRITASAGLRLAGASGRRRPADQLSGNPAVEDASSSPNAHAQSKFFCQTRTDYYFTKHTAAACSRPDNLVESFKYQHTPVPPPREPFACCLCIRAPSSWNVGHLCPSHIRAAL